MKLFLFTRSQYCFIFEILIPFKYDISATLIDNLKCKFNVSTGIEHGECVMSVWWNTIFTPKQINNLEWESNDCHRKDGMKHMCMVYEPVVTEFK